MNAAFLKANLCFVHGTMIASEGLLQAAIRRCEVDDLGLYFTRHLAEETGHLEWLEQDLATLGVVEIPHFAEAAQLAGAQYYYIEHVHPAMLLGYMAAFECNPMPLTLIDELEAEHGQLKCTRHHALHDIEHGKSLRSQINGLQEPLRTRVLENEAYVLNDWKTRITPLILAATYLF